MKTKISPRQNKILKAIIREYIATALPVASKRIVRKYNFKISSATMRNEMGVLEQKGLVMHPHPSAGRVPTDRGYRYFVDYLMQERSLSRDEQKKLAIEFLQTKAAHSKLLRQTTKLISKLTGNVALASILDEGVVFDAGLRYLLEEPEFAETEPLYEMVQMMDSLDEHMNDLVKSDSRAVEVYIGRENPLCSSRECATIVSQFRLPSGERGIIALIGPKRMRYSRNMSILDYITKLLSGVAMGGFFLVDWSEQISKFLNLE